MILGYVGICGLKEMSQSDKKTTSDNATYVDKPLNISILRLKFKTHA